MSSRKQICGCRVRFESVDRQRKTIGDRDGYQKTTLASEYEPHQWTLPLVEPVWLNSLLQIRHRHVFGLVTKTLRALLVESTILYLNQVRRIV